MIVGKRQTLGSTKMVVHVFLETLLHTITPSKPDSRPTCYGCSLLASGRFPILFVKKTAPRSAQFTVHVTKNPREPRNRTDLRAQLKVIAASNIHLAYPSSTPYSNYPPIFLYFLKNLGFPFLVEGQHSDSPSCHIQAAAILNSFKLIACRTVEVQPRARKNLGGRSS